MTHAPFREKEFQEELAVHEKIAKRNWKKKT